MEKRLRIFITIAVMLIIVIGSISIKEVLEPTNGDVVQSEAQQEFGIDEEGQIYVIGKHLFTEKTPYLSKEKILLAANTIDNLPDNMTEEQILNYITIYARDAKDNWINARTGEIITFEDDFKFDIEYIDLKEIKEDMDEGKEPIIDGDTGNESKNDDTEKDPKDDEKDKEHTEDLGNGDFNENGDQSDNSEPNENSESSDNEELNEN